MIYHTPNSLGGELLHRFLHCGVHSGVHCGVHSGVHCGVHSGVHCGVHSGVHCGVHSGVHCGVHSGVHCGVHSGVHCGVHSGVKFCDKSKFINFSKIITDTKMKISWSANILMDCRMIYQTPSSHDEKILHKFLHCSVHSGVIYTNFYTVVYIFV